MFNWLKLKQKPISTKPKTLGQTGEEFAQGVYKKQGFEIVGTNVFNKKGLRKGEVDFIAKDNSHIVFVEVKTRSGRSKYGTAEEAVNTFKQIKLLKAVKLYLLQNPKFNDLVPRIDVCVVEYGEFDKTFKCAKIITNAVEDIYYG